jgi:3'-phosphoadenosine 5'-phosphosulfate sulfotransferase (PAPS reductase)/FAD synthetase
VIVSWFSAGVSSAVATKLALKKYPDLTVLYIDIDDQHPDSLRFVKDCEEWFGVPVTILKSPYGSVDKVCRAFAFVNGVGGARCTTTLKRRTRREWEMAHNPTHYIWGFDASKRERERAKRVEEQMADYKHTFPLIEEGLLKQDAHGMLLKAGIKRPYMYDLGYPNNNCIGCVKGGKGYWNKIRKDFPEVFHTRAKMERDIGHTCIKGVWLDELNPDEGREQKIIVEDCGILCQLKEIK